MAIAALTLGIVALFTWILPPLGFIVSIIGIVLGVVALVKKQQKRRAIAGAIMCSVGLVLNIAVVVGLIAAGLILEELLHQYFAY